MTRTTMHDIAQAIRTAREGFHDFEGAARGQQAITVVANEIAELLPVAWRAGFIRECTETGTISPLPPEGYPSNR